MVVQYFKANRSEPAKVRLESLHGTKFDGKVESFVCGRTFCFTIFS